MVHVVAALGGSDCERLRSGWLAQPANAVSSLGYVVVGVWLLWRCRRSGVDRAPLAAGALAMVGVGVGSVAYHGPQPGWAHVAHDGSVVCLALVIIGHSIWLLARDSVRRAVAYGFPCVVTAPLVAVTGRAALLSPLLLGGAVVGAALTHPKATTEAAVAAWRTSAGWMALALAAYAAGRTGSSLCHPGALWQPHAAWHVLSAVGLGFAVLGCSARSHGTGLGAACRRRRSPKRSPMARPGGVPQ
jgi:hypothetical protein